jgi:threonine/homoserine/homoserine lactone efflux protein
VTLSHAFLELLIVAALMVGLSSISERLLKVIWLAGGFALLYFGINMVRDALQKGSLQLSPEEKRFYSPTIVA